MLKLALCSLLIGSPALAQQCAGFADVSAHLAEKYGEAVAVRGLDAAGNAIVMFANPDTGTWTAFIVTPDGNACRVADGVAFEYHKPKPNA